MLFQNLTAPQRLNKAVSDLMGMKEFVALCGVLMIGNRQVVVDPQKDAPGVGLPKDLTVATDGKNEWWSKQLIESLTDAELRFVVLHETYHKMYRHLTTWQNLFRENHEIAGLACDFAINGRIMKIIKEANLEKPIKMPGGKNTGCYDAKYDNLDSGQIFKMIKDQMPPQSGGGCEGDGEGQGQKQQQSSGGGGKEKGKGKPQKGKDESQEGDGDQEQQQGGGGPQDQQSMDQHLWEQAQEMSPEEQDALEREIDQAIRQGALLAGKHGSGGNRNFDDLLQAKVNWKDQLREFVQNTFQGNDFSTWKRPNRRYIGMGHYLPSGISERMGELVIGIDTSGSIDQRTLTEFLSEVAAICKTVNPERVRVLYWDTRVAADEKYGGVSEDPVDQLVKSTKPAGGGGTDVRCMSDYMEQNGIKPQAAIIFTDGYLGGDWGSWSVPNLWCILNNRGATSPHGVTLHIESGDL